jgi:hypothetical protein
MKDVPEALNKITDIVLAYRRKPKPKAAQKREGPKEKEAKNPK